MNYQISVLLHAPFKCQATLRALKQQTLPLNQFELIVVEGSEEELDGCSEMLSGFNHQIHSGNPQSILSIKEAVLLVSSDIVVFLQSGYIPSPTWLETHVNGHTKWSMFTMILGQQQMGLEQQRLLFPQLMSGNTFRFSNPNEESVPFDSFRLNNLSLKVEYLAASDIWMEHDYHTLKYQVIELGFKLWLKGYRLIYEPAAQITYSYAYSFQNFLDELEQESKDKAKFIELNPHLLPYYFDFPRFDQNASRVCHEFISLNEQKVKQAKQLFFNIQNKTANFLKTNFKSNQAQQLLDKISLIRQYYWFNELRSLKCANNSSDTRYQLTIQDSPGKAWNVLKSMQSSRQAPDTEGGLHNLQDTIDVLPHTGDILYRLIRYFTPARVIETGFAYGASTLFILQALADNKRGQHMAIDPLESTMWNNVGVAAVERAGLSELFTLMEMEADKALPQLVLEQLKVDMMFIDGDHRFDRAFIDYYFGDQLLNIGGFMIFDDWMFDSVKALCNYIEVNQSYLVMREYSTPNLRVLRKMGDSHTWIPADRYFPFKNSF